MTARQGWPMEAERGLRERPDAFCDQRIEPTALRKILQQMVTLSLGNLS
jgi:hypothetical protein